MRGQWRRDFNRFLKDRQLIEKCWMMEWSGETPRTGHVQRGSAGGVNEMLNGAWRSPQTWK